MDTWLNATNVFNQTVTSSVN